MAITEENIEYPFSLSLKTPDESNPVLCRAPLRLLTGKRHVHMGSWGQREVVVKLFLDPKRARRHWARELAGVDFLKSATVSTPELLYSGQLDDGTPALLFEFLPGAQTALDLWPSQASFEMRQKFLFQLVEVIGALHDAGLVQNDLHLGNFLISQGKVYVIDGDAVRAHSFGQGLEMEESSRNLALFFAQLPPRFDSLIESTVHHYAQVRQCGEKVLLARLRKDLPVVRRRRRRKYVDKCYRDCSEFVRVATPQGIAVLRRDRQGATLSRFLADPDTFMGQGTLLKDGNSSTVARVRGDGFDWVVKRYNIKNVWHRLSRCWRPTRAWVSWGNAHRLKISGIATPAPIAVFENRFGPLRATGYYVCEYVDRPHAETYFQDRRVPEDDRRQVAEAFVELFDQFRLLAMGHGDCKATNFLIKGHSPWVLDLDAMHEYRPGARFERVYSLDRARFLNNWQTLPELQRWFDEHLPSST